MSVYYVANTSLLLVSFPASLLLLDDFPNAQFSLKKKNKVQLMSE
jgi:hypothetical protein